MAEVIPSEFQHLLVAVLIGALIGLDRERSEVRKSHQLFAGIRTFPLIALTWALPMLLYNETCCYLTTLSGWYASGGQDHILQFLLVCPL
ncbi:MAG: MgtC/SapB family protein [Deltaproteobacteria bacterium]|nr:MgtC/SapB family protein [Deltaproteobacteria bacterium]